MGPVFRAAIAVAIAFVLATDARAQPTPQQKIAMLAKPSVVRVWGAYIATFELGGERAQVAIGGSGTGFFITADGYVATNAHVVSDIHDGDDKAKKALYNKFLAELRKAYARQLAQMSAAQINQLLDAIQLVELQKRAYVVLPSGEKLEYEIKQYGKPASGRDAAILKVKTENAPALAIGDSKKSQVADQIVVIGYPGVADMKVLLDEKSQLEASVTDGAISSLKRATSGEQILQISAPITHGNSGGPALDMQGNVVGLATFGNESEIQGFNFLVASATLLELVRDAKLQLAPSETLRLWKQGLDHYWANEFTTAIEKFREVETLFPVHSEAGTLIRNSNQAKKEGKEKKPASGGGGGGLIAGLVIGGLVVVGGGVFALRRKKPGHAPQPFAHGAPPPGAPGFPPPPGAPPPGAPYPPPPGPPGFAPQQQAGFAPQQQAGFAPQQQAGFAPQQQAGFAPQQMYGRAPQMPHGPPQMPHGAPQMPHGAPQMPHGAPQMPHGAPGQPPIAKTVAIQAASPPAAGIAPTAFGSMSIGSLTCTRGHLVGQRFALTATGIIIGRQPGVAHVLVNDHRASGKHVWIGLDQGRLVAIDQGTTNGTYVNDVGRGRITRQELRDGDVVIIGEPDCMSLQVKLG